MIYPNYQQYLNDRNALITQDDSHWFDFNPQPSPEEENLNMLLDEQRRVMIKDFEKYDLGFLPSEPFYKIRLAMEATPLFHVFRIMPKGGQLHMHTSASASAEWILNTLLNESGNGLPNAYVYIAKKGSAQRYIDRQLAFFRNPPAGFVSVKDVLKDGRFYDDMVDRLTFGSARVESVPYIWDEFNRIFAMTSELLKNQTFYEKYYLEAFKTLLDDNITYLELRAGFASFTETSDNMPPNNNDFELQFNYNDRVVINGIRNRDVNFLDTLKAVEIAASEYAEGIGKTFSLKLIMCGNRRQDSYQDAIEKMRYTAELKQLPGYADFIIGFDVVGEEDRGRRTADYAKEIIESGMQNHLDFYFHDGESNWAYNNNVMDAYLLGSKRIGHGFNLINYPDLTDMIRQESERSVVPLALEICPISNQLLRYVPDLRTHPAYQLMKRGVQCVICSDDPQIFGNHGLSYDYWETYVGFHLDLMQIKKLVYNSVLFSAMSETEQAIEFTALDNAWNQFVTNAVNYLNGL